MLSKKHFTIIGLTTFSNEFLRISIPGIARLNKKKYLIIHNDNPVSKVTEKQIRRLGYSGPLHIINANKNFGSLKSRLNILSAIADLKIKSDWMVFVDDDDIITNIDIPDIAPNNFAVMQNTAIVKKRLIDLFKLMDNPTKCVVDNDNIVMDRPHIGICGTLIRTNIMIDLGRLIDVMLDKIYQINDSLGYRPPVEQMMWRYLTLYAKHLNPNAAPIYMDRINYIAISLDSVSNKYGQHLFPPNNHERHFESALRRYNAIFDEVIHPKNN